VDVEQINRRVERNNRTIDREVDGYVSTLTLLMQRKILRELAALPGRELRRREALRLLGGMESIILEDEEIMGHIESLEDIFDLQFSMMEDLYRLANDNREPPKNGRVPAGTFAVFVNSRQQNVQVMARAYANEVRQRLADSIISGEPVSDFDITEAPVTRIVGALSGDLKTANATYSRMVALEQAGRFVLYAGPRDARNREFCAERVNNIYPMQEVYTWDNGQGLPAHLYCGGWGCRHVLIPVRQGQGVA
jgi:hypothetical protein